MQSLTAQQPIEELDVLIAHLGSRSAAERESAKKALIARGAEAVGPLLTQLTQASARRQRNRSLRYALCGLTVPFALWLEPHMISPIYWLWLLVFIPATLMMMRLNAATFTQIQAAQALAGIDDVRAVGPLAEALEFRDMWFHSNTTRLATDNLLRLLPQLQPEDALLLDSHQRRCLYRALNAPAFFKPELAYAILAALGQVGDQDALAPVARFANRVGFLDAQTELRNFAQQTLALIQARVEVQRAPTVLLRPSTASGADNLLRAVAGTGETAPEELLRADNTEF